MKNDSSIKILEKYPRLASHIICESLGYFTPKGAARAINCYKNNKPYFNEWYSHQASLRSNREKEMDENKLIQEINKETIKHAFKNRHHHRAPMA